MAALPYIQLYVADYLADTMHLTTEEHGAYLLIIMNYWQTGKPIPEKRLAGITKLSNERLTDVKESLSEYFTITDDSLWIHERIEVDLLKVNAKSKQASAAGKASAAKRAKSKASIKTDDRNDRSKSVERESNHTDTDTDTDTDKDTDKDINNNCAIGDSTTEKQKSISKHKNPDLNILKSGGKSIYSNSFIEFWEARPRRAGGDSKIEAAQAWNARIKDGFTANEMTEGIIRYKFYCDNTDSTGTQYVKQTARFIGAKLYFQSEWEIPKQKPDKKSVYEQNMATVDRMNSEQAQTQEIIWQ